jgi:hypothetical protein
VGINNDSSAPDNSALLEVKSTLKGMLVTRMTNAQISSFGSTLGTAHKGMIVLNADDIKIEYRDGTSWKTMVTKSTASGGRKLKETDDAFLWATSSNSGNNNSGFTALPGGFWYYIIGIFANLRSCTYFWSSSESSSSGEWGRWLTFSDAGVFRFTKTRRTDLRGAA